MKKFLFAGIALRLFLLVYCWIHDRYFQVKFTDIDYNVFTEGAYYSYAGSSPYDRPTFRYSPLLAWMLIPNVLYFYSFGKLLFIACDILVSLLLYKLLQKRIGGEKAIKFTCLYLLNPFVAVISVRGNAESFIGLLVILAYYLVESGYIRLGAVVFGISVHTKVYTVIYAITFLKSLSGLHLFSRKNFIFAFVSFSTFMVLNALMYYLYGWKFVYETFLYHVIRKDHRHNFSVYSYYTYLHFLESNSILNFLPQLLLTFGTGWLLGSEFMFAAFVQTFVFVTFNKVCTSQYFIWYLVFVPWVAYKVNVNWIKMLIPWIVAQGLWLYYAYQLEIQGKNTFWQLFLAGVAFFVANVFVICSVILNKRG